MHAIAVNGCQVTGSHVLDNFLNERFHITNALIVV